MLKDVSLSLLTRSLVIASGLITSIVTARVLGVSGRGEYFFIITLAGLATQFGNFGLIASNTYSLAKDHSLLARLAANSFWVSSIIGLILAIGIVFIVGDMDEPIWRRPEWFLLLLVPCMLYGQMSSNLLIGMSLISRYNLFLMISTLLQLMAILAAAVMVFDVMGFIAASAAASLMSAGVLMRMLRRLHTLIWSFDWALLRTYLGYGLRAYFATLFAFGVSRAGVLILDIYWEKDEIGIYSIAVQFADVLIILPSTVGMILFPELLKGAENRRFSRSVRAAIRIASMMGLLCLLIAFAAPWLIELLFGEEFLPAVHVLWWMMPGIVCLSFTIVLSQYLAARGIPLANIFIWLGGLVFLLIAVVITVPEMGSIGAAISLSCTYLLVMLAIISLAFRQKHLESVTNLQGG